MASHVVMFVLVTLCWLGFKACAGSVQPSGYFWHVTDFHLDLNYSSLGNAYRMCWDTRENEDTVVIPGGNFGDYQCDSPYRLVQSAMDGMKKLGDKPDFILWTGDDKAHVKDSFFSQDIVLQLITNLTKTLESTFPQVPIVPVLGNHDWFPTHQLPAQGDVLYDKIADLWEPWLGEQGNKTFRKGGYYSRTLDSSGITFMVLNTAIYYQKNEAVKDELVDPGGQFEWMKQQFQEARDLNKKVFVTSHVPAGVFERHFEPNGWTWLKESYNKRYVEVIIENSDVIIGQFFAHHHTDSFRVFYNDTGAPVSWLLVAPAVTPWNTTLSGVGPNNPGLRKYYYSTSNHKIETFHQYYLNLSRANKEDKDKWSLEYNAKEAYNLTDGITPQSLHDLVTSFNQADRKTFDQYYLYNSVSYQPASDCDEYCRKYHICAITNVHFQDFRQCYKERLSGGNDSDNSALFLCPTTWLYTFLALVMIAMAN